MEDLPTLDDHALEQIRALPGAATDGFVRKLVEVYRRQAVERLEGLHAAVACSDHDDIHRIAHSWKTSAGQLGAMRLREQLGRVDELGRTRRTVGLRRLVADVAVEHERVLHELEQRLA